MAFLFSFNQLWDSRAEYHQIFALFFEKFKTSKSRSEIKWPLKVLFSTIRSNNIGAMNVKAQIIKGKVSILGVVVLWGDCMDIPKKWGYSIWRCQSILFFLVKINIDLI